ncbi:MAG: isochorismatase family cysteine hydrolase [Nitriliruptoraceae bacterium]
MNPADVGLPTGQIRPAAVTIDLHRGHLDPDVATMALTPERSRAVIEANVQLLDAVRSRDVPVVHVVTRYRNVAEIAMNPFWRSVADTDASRTNVMRHNLDGSPGLELMPGLYSDGYDHIVDTKKRYDCFVATDLEFLLRSLNVNLLLLTGVNTNSCVLATTIQASVRDFSCIVVSDCVDTVDGEELHEAALQCVDRAFGNVADTSDVLAFLDENLST